MDRKERKNCKRLKWYLEMSITFFGAECVKNANIDIIFVSVFVLVCLCVCDFCLLIEIKWVLFAHNVRKSQEIIQFSFFFWGGKRRKLLFFFLIFHETKMKIKLDYYFYFPLKTFFYFLLIRQIFVTFSNIGRMSFGYVPLRG